MEVSYFKELYKSKGDIKKLVDVVDEIKSGTHKKLIRSIKLHLEDGTLSDSERSSLIQKKKAKLPIFNPCLLTTNKSSSSKGGVATGLVQVDIDASDNPDVDMSQIKDVLSSLPYTVYVFQSPKGGLKWAGKTDFESEEGETENDLTARFRTAYDRTLLELKKHVDVCFDDCARSISRLCFLSHDPDIYFNPNPETLVLGPIAVPVDVKQITSHVIQDSVAPDFIDTLLSFVPAASKHPERFKVGCVLFSQLGSEGQYKYVDKFEKNHAKLLHEWSNIEKHQKHGHIGTLVNIAKENGYKPRQSNGRRFERAKPSQHRFDPPVSVQEARKHLNDILTDCIRNKKSHYISMSCGLGKTDTMLDAILDHGSDMKIMICTPTGQLQDQIHQNLIKKIEDKFDFFTAQQKITGIKATKGRLTSDEHGPMCIQADVVTKLQNIEAGLPVTECYKCPVFDTCRYLRQFQDFDTIRIVTTSQYFNGPGIWDGGSKDGKKGKLPLDKPFKPDLIIIDENAIQEHVITAGLDTPFGSLQVVISHCGTGKGLAKAVQKCANQILTDHAVAKSAKKTLSKQILNGSKSVANDYDAKHFVILEAFAKYIMTGYDDSMLDGIRFRKAKYHNKPGITPLLEKLSMKQVADEYQDVPVIILDATAEEAVVKAVFPKIPFTKMIVEQNDDVKIHQLEGTSVTKRWLKGKGNVNKIVDRINGILTKKTVPNKKVGLITFKSIDGDQQFHQTLGQRIGATKISYFGNLRGSNDFEDVDFLFVVGRNAANGIVHERFAKAVFDHDWAGDKEYVDQLVAMQDGRSFALNASCYTNDVDQVIYRHCSVNETIQAVGRSRPIHGGPKQVYLFSNESLGEDVRITSFFGLTDSQYADQFAAIHERGFIDWKSKQHRDACGITDHTRKHRQDVFFEDAMANDLEVVVVDGVDTSRHVISKTFITANTELLVESLEAANTTVEEVRSYSTG